MVLRYLRPFLIIVLILNTYLLSVQLVVSHYDLHPVQKDHNGNKRNHFLFFCVILGIGWQAIEHCNLCILDVYFMYMFNITLCCFI